MKYSITHFEVSENSVCTVCFLNVTLKSVHGEALVSVHAFLFRKSQQHVNAFIYTVNILISI